MIAPVQYPVDPQVKKASDVIAARLGLQAGDVSIGTGDENQSGVLVYSRGGDDPVTHLVISVHKPGTDLAEEMTRSHVRNVFNQLPPIAKIANTVDFVKLSAETGDKAKKAVEGTEFNRKLLEWAGFDPKAIQDGKSPNDYALAWVNSSAYGMEFRLHIPVAKNVEPKPIVEQVDANIKERLPAIRAMLTERVIKYTKANLAKLSKTPEEIEAAVTKVQADMEKLEIAVNNDGNRVIISLRSAEQAVAYKAAGEKWDTPDNADALKANNPLHGLSETETEQEPHPQLQKALARAFLYAGDKAMDVFPLVAGRGDMKAMLRREFKRVDAPDKTETFKQILESDLFKNHNRYRSSPNKTEDSLPDLEFKKDPKEADTVQVWIKIPVKTTGAMLDGAYVETTDNKIADTITELAALPTQAPAQQAATSTQAAATTTAANTDIAPLIGIVAELAQNQRNLAHAVDQAVGELSAKVASLQPAVTAAPAAQTPVVAPATEECCEVTKEASAPAAGIVDPRLGIGNPLVGLGATVSPAKLTPTEAQSVLEEAIKQAGIVSTAAGTAR